MKKIIAAVVVVAAGAGVVGPKIIGSSVEPEYKRQFEQIPEHTGIKYQHRSFENGWFSSSAETEMSMVFGVPELDAVRAVLTSEIKHGPVMSTSQGIKTGFSFAESEVSIEGLPQEADQFIQQHFDGVPVQITTLTGFDMMMQSTMTMPGFTVEVPNQASFSFGGLEMTAVGDMDGNNSKIDLVLKETNIKDPSSEVILAESSGSFEFEKYNDFVMLGGGKFNFPSIDIKTMLAMVSLENLSIEVDSQEQDGKIDFREVIAVEKVVAPLPVSATSYEIEINNLAPEAIEKWYSFSMEMNTLMSQAQQANSDAVPEMDEKKIRELVTTVLQKDLELNQLLVIEGMGGEISADVDVTYVGLADDVHPMDVQDSMQMLEALDVNVLVQADERAIMQTPAAMMIGPYIQQGFIVQENGKLITRAVITGGEMTLNGQPFPIEMLLGSVDDAQQEQPADEMAPMEEQMPQ